MSKETMRLVRHRKRQCENSKRNPSFIVMSEWKVITQLTDPLIIENGNLIQDFEAMAKILLFFLASVFTENATYVLNPKPLVIRVAI